MKRKSKAPVETTVQPVDEVVVPLQTLEVGDSPLQTVPEVIIELDPMLEWKKIGGGAYHMGNRIIKPNQVFKARPSQIPLGFRDVVICLNEDKLKMATHFEVTKNTEADYTIQKTEEGFDVVNMYGKKINSATLTEKEASQLKKALSA